MGVGNQDWIPLDQLTDDQQRVIDGLIIEFFNAGNLEIVSPERTTRIVDVALQEGFERPEAERLARHFDAAVEMVQAMSAQDRDNFRQQVQRKMASANVPRP